MIPFNGGNPRKVSEQERESFPGRSGVYNKNGTRKLYEQGGDIYIYTVKSNNKACFRRFACQDPKTHGLYIIYAKGCAIL